MLEILAPIYVVKEIKKTANKKSIKPGKWGAAAFISWFTIKILVFTIAFVLLDLYRDTIIMVMIFVILAAAKVAFVILEKLKQHEPCKI